MNSNIVDKDFSIFISDLIAITKNPEIDFSFVIGTSEVKMCIENYLLKNNK